MNASEKRLMIVFGVALSCVAGYYILNGVFLGPIKQAREDKAKYTNEANRLVRTIKSEKKLAREWESYVSRTFSFDQNQSFDWFGEVLKDTAAKNGFTAPNIKKRTSTKRLGKKTGIEVISYEITVKDEFTKAMKLLRAMYDSQYVSQVSDVMFTPETRDGRDVVKLSFQVSTLILPEVSKKESREFAKARPQMHDPKSQMGRWRQDFPPASAFAVFTSKNIFREYMPPPTNTVIVDNLDRKLVGIRATYLWDGEVQNETQIGVQPGKQETIVGKGNLVEIVGAYADGTEFKQKHAFNDGKPWSYKVPTYTDPEPPKVINLAVDSRDKAEARFTLTITEEDGKKRTLPPMVIGPESKISLGEFEAKEIRVAAVYETGRNVNAGTFRPSTNEQVYLIPEQAKAPPPDENTEPTRVVREDDPPAPGYTVTGMLTYRDNYEKRDKQELIVNGPDGREIFVAGDQRKLIDGGVLISVCPLGGIVYMPNSENYYLYPRGEGFEMRARLNAERPEQLAMAIEEWSRQN
ncbi:MAG TPA: hypothetical protein P5081_12190 [Phycisphaerae bacterium]|nr:hypothetical protein [Phycisphaerae bacterium]HRW53635.1 hypothetical protein [Phycisphaerae bacterium]